MVDEKRNLIGKNVYFILKNTNGTFTIGYNKLESMVISEKTIWYRIYHYNNLKIYDIFETREDLFKHLGDLLFQKTMINE